MFCEPPVLLQKATNIADSIGNGLDKTGNGNYNIDIENTRMIHFAGKGNGCAMKKVGIITHYHGSRNYGGLLQAYALCRVLAEHGISCEQISYDMLAHRPLNPAPLPSFGRRMRRALRRRLRGLYRRISGRYVDPRVWSARRDAACADFRERIPHSKTVYTEATVSQCVGDYAAFITGSDQVWNTDWYCPAYFLDFVPDHLPKLAYAASLGHGRLTEADRAVFRRSLSTFRGISVREASAVEAVREVCSVPVQCCLDPTLLLTREAWDGIASPRVIREPYVLCYFLGGDPCLRRVARSYAGAHGFSLAVIPTSPDEDSRFGDRQMADANPEDFISLIRHAECLFTDSFHAVAFAALYQRPFFVCERKGSPGMNTRLYDLTELLGARHRICTDHGDPEAIAPIDYSAVVPRLEARRQESISYLLEQLTL